MHMNIDEWDKTKNTYSERVAVWGDTPEYSEHIRSIVRDITNNGYAERGDVLYYDSDEPED